MPITASSNVPVRQRTPWIADSQPVFVSRAFVTDGDRCSCRPAAEDRD